MKKFISVFLVFLVLLTSLPLASFASSPSFKVAITAPEAYKAGDVIDVTVTVSDVSVSGGISFFNFDLYYDNSLLSINAESAALLAMVPFHYWDDLTRINGTWNPDGSFAVANDGVIEFFAGDIGSDDGEQWHNLVDGEQIVFKFSFTALDDASADASIWINGENSACGAYTDDASNPVGYVEYAGLGESATVTKTVLYNKNAVEGGHIAGSAANCTQPQVCTGCGMVLQAALGHEYNSVVTPPNCTEQGYTTHTCTTCGDVVVDSYADELGHEYNSVVTPPSCTEQGYTTHTCTACGDVVVDSYVDVTGHDDGEWMVITEATYESAGSEGRYCTQCGELLETRAISKKYHRGDINADGLLNVVDCMLLKRYTLGAAKLDGFKEGAEERADINNDDGYNAVDYMMLKRAVLGQYTIVD